MGCFYTGFNYKQRVNGYFKIGESGKDTPAQRLSQLRQNESFECLGYLLLNNDTKADRLFIESYVRMKMEHYYLELTQVRNDYFAYTIKSADTKYTQAQKFANTALNFAIEACKMTNVKYKIGTKTYKRG